MFVEKKRHKCIFFTFSDWTKHLTTFCCCFFPRSNKYQEINVFQGTPPLPPRTQFLLAGKTPCWILWQNLWTKRCFLKCSLSEPHFLYLRSSFAEWMSKVLTGSIAVVIVRGGHKCSNQHSCPPPTIICWNNWDGSLKLSGPKQMWPMEMIAGGTWSKMRIWLEMTKNRWFIVKVNQQEEVKVTETEIRCAG